MMFAMYESSQKIGLYRPNYVIRDKITGKSLPEKGLGWFLANRNALSA
jgi:hypothetical protein